jgi:hypothetical protein
MRVRVKDLQINTWCPVCNKPVHFSCTMLINDTYADNYPNIREFPETCQCALIFTQAARTVPLVESVDPRMQIPDAFLKSFHEGELEP